MWSRHFFERHPVEVAKDLIGAELLVNGAGGLIVETEAYHHEEPASHSFRGETPRNRAMFGEAGTVYVYRSYGIHWCLNFVCLPGSAVLIRALQPVWDIAGMQDRRGVSDVRLLCSGPGRLCQALGVSIAENGLPLENPPFRFIPAVKAPPVSVGRRIGISRAAELPWRFGWEGSAFVSKRF